MDVKQLEALVQAVNRAISIRTLTWQELIKYDSEETPILHRYFVNADAAIAGELMFIKAELEKELERRKKPWIKRIFRRRPSGSSSSMSV